MRSDIVSFRIFIGVFAVHKFVDHKIVDHKIVNPNNAPIFHTPPSPRHVPSASRPNYP